VDHDNAVARAILLVYRLYRWDIFGFEALKMDSDTRFVATIFGTSFVGIILSMILYEMNTRGIIIDEFITGTIVINDLILIVNILFLLVGVMLATIWR